MNEDDLFETMAILVTEATTTAGALENLRSGRPDRALEALEGQLETSVVLLGKLAPDLPPADRERVKQSLKSIGDYRRRHPRRVETDMAGFDQAVVVGAAELRERARRVLEGNQ